MLHNNKSSAIALMLLYAYAIYLNGITSYHFDMVMQKMLQVDLIPRASAVSYNVSSTILMG